MSNHDAAWATSAQADLRAVLDEWDPIGVAREAPDEYDCIRDPLISRLLRGADRREVKEFLSAEMTDHFGLSTAAVTDDVVDQILAWWSRTG